MYDYRLAIYNLNYFKVNNEFSNLPNDCILCLFNLKYIKYIKNIEIH